MWTSWFKINSAMMTKLVLEWRGMVCALGMSRAIFVKGTFQPFLIRVQRAAEFR